MRLLNTKTLQLEFFVGETPCYAVLSHRWEEEEVTYEDMHSGTIITGMKGYKKIQSSAHVALESGHDYLWIDTCCIDKSSSAELSEAINSMFKWYMGAAECIAYLCDVDTGGSILDSRWFTRGWTLQEMIAPRHLTFYDQHWQPCGTNEDWKEAIHQLTGVPAGVLDRTIELHSVPLCCKMSWAASRVTTRPEDIAYCLLGIVGVNMPLLYGEGATRAFRRLQEAIIRENDDESIFAWTASPEEAAQVPYWGLLAPSPAYFKDSKSYTIPRFKAWRTGDPVELTNRGLRLSLALFPIPEDQSKTQFLAVLNCSRSRENRNAVANAVTLTLQKLSEFENQYTRVCPDQIRPVPITHDAGGYEESPTPTESVRIFVRENPKPTDPVLGFCTDKMQRVEFDFPTNSMQGPIILKGFTDVEMEASEPWTSQKVSQSRQIFSIEVSTESSSPSIAGPRRRLDAVLKVKCSSFLREEANGNFPARVSPFLTGPNLRDPYLVLGMEDLPPNATGTPSGFLRPWYAFSGSNEAKALHDLVTGDPVAGNETHTAPGHCRFRVELQATSLNFRTFYDIKLVSMGRQ